MRKSLETPDAARPLRRERGRTDKVRIRIAAGAQAMSDVFAGLAHRLRNGETAIMLRQGVADVGVGALPFFFETRVSRLRPACLWPPAASACARPKSARGSLGTCRVLR